MDTKKMTGKWVKGVGQAGALSHKFDKIFGTRMTGTFNVRLSDDFLDFPHCSQPPGGRLWLVRLDGRYYGYAYRMDQSRMPLRVMEVYSKERFPEALKSRPFKVEFLAPWSKEEISKWSSSVHWFQSFPWSSKQRSDSQLVWDTINRVNWGGARVLDVGCNHGFFSFQASRMGAKVIGFDKNSKSLNVARTINDHIEMADVEFVKQDPGGVYDVILLLSVLHQDDPAYKTLHTTLNQWRKRCRRLFLELIAPPLEGNLKVEQVDRIVGAEPLLSYKHKVRCHRRIYDLS